MGTISGFYHDFWTTQMKTDNASLDNIKSRLKFMKERCARLEKTVINTQNQLLKASKGSFTSKENNLDGPISFDQLLENNNDDMLPALTRGSLMRQMSDFSSPVPVSRRKLERRKTTYQ